MGRIVYVNGEYLPEEAAKISVFDRGFLFADGVYEVSSVLEGKLIDNEAHMVRLQRSLDELRMRAPISIDEIKEVQQQIIARNALQEGVVYLQVTRGAADRDFPFPNGAVPSLVAFSQARKLLGDPLAERGIAVVTLPDIRWQRRDIKTVQLLASALAKQAALEAGADDAWLVEDGVVTEGSSNNAYIVTLDGSIVTRPLSNSILHGITRRAVLRLAGEQNLTIEERGFTPEEAYEAAEAFITSASAFVYPVVRIDDRILGNGAPGPVASRLRELYIEMALKES